MLLCVHGNCDVNECHGQVGELPMRVAVTSIVPVLQQRPWMWIQVGPCLKFVILLSTRHDIISHHL